MIFLEVYDLPDSFSFAHYTCTSLNAITVSFIHVQVSILADMVLFQFLIMCVCVCMCGLSAIVLRRSDGLHFAIGTCHSEQARIYMGFRQWPGQCFRTAAAPPRIQHACVL